MLYNEDNGVKVHVLNTFESLYEDKGSPSISFAMKEQIFSEILPMSQVAVFPSVIGCSLTQILLHDATNNMITPHTQQYYSFC